MEKEAKKVIPVFSNMDIIGQTFIDIISSRSEDIIYPTWEVQEEFLKGLAVFIGNSMVYSSEDRERLMHLKILFDQIIKTQEGCIIKFYQAVKVVSYSEHEKIEFISRVQALIHMLKIAVEKDFYVRKILDIGMIDKIQEDSRIMMTFIYEYQILKTITSVGELENKLSKKLTKISIRKVRRYLQEHGLITRFRPRWMLTREGIGMTQEVLKRKESKY